MSQKVNQKKKSHKKMWIILAITAVVIIGLIAWGVHAVKNMAKSMTEAMSSNTEKVEKGAIEVITEGTGTIEAADSHALNMEYSVKLRHLYKQNGEAVKAGEIIAEFDKAALDESVSALENQLSSLDMQIRAASKEGKTTVTAPVAGRVKRIWALEDASVLEVQNSNPGLVELSADGRLKTEIITEQQAVPGQKVTVVYGEERIAGLVETVRGNTITVTFEDSQNYEVDAEVAVWDTNNTKLGIGKTQSSHPVYVTADSGKIKSISVNVNDKVSAGSTLLKLTDTSYNASYIALLEQREQLAEKAKEAKAYLQGYAITAETDGIVSELTAKEGDMLPAGTIFCRFLDTSSYQAVLNIDELDIKGIEAGQKVQVTVDAAGDAVFEGTVSSVALAGNNENGVAGYFVSVALTDAVDVLPGMSVNGKITVDHHKDALLVPVEALQTKDGKKTVTIVNKDGTTKQREVTLGLVNNEFAEVLEGVSEGEQVKIIMKLEDIYSQMGISMTESNPE